MLAIKSWLVAGAILASTVTLASAQTVDAFGMFTRVLSMIEIRANQKAWQELDPRELKCLDGKLSEQGVGLSSLVQSGASPDDVRLEVLRRQCAVQSPVTGATAMPGVTAGVLNDLERALSKPGAVSGPAQGGVDDSGSRASVEVLRQQLISFDAGSNPALAAMAARATREVDAVLSGSVTPDDVNRLQQRLSELRDAASRETGWSLSYKSAMARRQLAEGRPRESLPPEYSTRLAAIGADMDLLVAGATAYQISANNYSLPSDRCDNASDPISSVMCQDDAARWLKLDYIRADYLLRKLYPEDQQTRVDAMREFGKEIIAKCRVKSALQNGIDRKSSIQCLSSAFRSQRDQLTKQVLSSGSGDAADELGRSITDHLKLQGYLRDLGFLPAGETVDGRYGTETRAAIASFQAANHLAVTGLMSAATATQLETSTRVPALHTSAQISALNAIVAQYDTYLSDAAKAEAEAAEQTERGQRVARARKLLAAYLSSGLRTFLQSYVESAGGAAADKATLQRLDQEFGARLSEINLADTVLGLVTDDSRVLVAQSGGYVAMYNASPSANAVTVKLDGTLSFDNDSLRACSIFLSSPDPIERSFVRQMLAKIGAVVRLPVSACDDSRLHNYDVVLVQPGTESLDRIVPVLSATRDGLLREAGRLTPQQIQADLATRANSLSIAKANISSGTDSGFGFVGLSNGSSTICAIVASGIDSHRDLLDARDEEVRDELGAKPNYVVQSVDDTFVSAKRQQCGAIYADAADLQQILKGFDRDRIDYQVWPEWFDDASIKLSTAAWTSRQAATAQKAAEEARKLADQEAINAAKSAEHDAVRQRQEAALHQEYGAPAKALELRFNQELSDFLRGDPNETAFADKYPALAAEYHDLVADHWELMTQGSEILDYGTADFKGRQLELGVGRSVVKLRNRLLGEYKDLCFVTAFVDDVEFAMERDPVGFNCDDDPNLLKTYELGEKFESLWIVP